MDKELRAYLKEKVSDKQKAIRKRELLSKRFNGSLQVVAEEVTDEVTIHRVGNRSVRRMTCQVCYRPGMQINDKNEMRHHIGATGDWCPAGTWGPKGAKRGRDS